MPDGPERKGKDEKVGQHIEDAADHEGKVLSDESQLTVVGDLSTHGGG